MNQNDIQSEVIRALPPVGVSATSYFGVTLQDWVLYVTIVYTLLLIAQKILKLADWWWWERKGKK
ncbi:hypothetical protein [Anaeroselena agilis]|uniref:Holin n=1 Tax=Anaeroselena agilis TaxID=3063788 RepID=A0ABU3NUZ9_9FIRM|nr:hypothetical protein [Selenomonadales bacterium 4137-cl]